MSLLHDHFKYLGSHFARYPSTACERQPLTEKERYHMEVKIIEVTEFLLINVIFFRLEYHSLHD